MPTTLPFRINTPAGGDNINPRLNITGVPDNTNSLVLIMHDPDAVGGDFTHWIAWNIPPGTTEIAQNSPPEDAAEGTTSFGTTGWGGPCPPAGTGNHRYIFKLYALDTTLDLPPETKRSGLEQAMRSHIIAQTKLTGIVTG